MFKFISLLVFVAFSIKAIVTPVTCYNTTNPLNETTCNSTFGCLWTNEINNEYNCSDVFTDLDTTSPFYESYEVWTGTTAEADCLGVCTGNSYCGGCYPVTYGGETKYFQYPVGATPDACNYAAATDWTGATFPCTLTMPFYCTGTGAYCYGSYYGDMENAGICSKPTTIAGCTALPFCNWNSSNDNDCQPDYDCYLYWYNYNAGGCRTSSPHNCKIDTTNDSVTKGWCTADTLTSERRACNVLVEGILPEADRKAACTGNCEYVEGGVTPSTYTPYPGASFYGWCVPIGSGAFAIHVSSFVLAVLLTVMLAFL